MGCDSLACITLPHSLTEIGEDAFFNFYSLTSLVITDSVNDIAQHSAFNECHSLTQVSIPKHINPNIFPKSCKLIIRNP